MTVGTKIKKLRELRNYTQQYMADQLELSVSGYSKIERDESDLTISRLEKIAEVLDVDLRSILSFDENMIFNICDNAAPYIAFRDQTINQQELYDKIIAQYKQEIEDLKEIIYKLLAR
jgi:transcriptional regulator with XRE-family HTH domain